MAGVAAFVIRQVALQDRGRVLLDMRVFRSRSFTISLLVMVVVAMNGFGTLIVLPLVPTNVLGMSTLALGLFLVPGGAVIGVVPALSGRVYDRFGPRLPVPAAVVLTASLWFLSTVDEGIGVGTVLAAHMRETTTTSSPVVVVSAIRLAARFTRPAFATDESPHVCTTRATNPGCRRGRTRLPDPARRPCCVPRHPGATAGRRLRGPR